MNIAGGFPVSVRRALLGGLLALPGILLPVAGAGAAVVAQPTTADGAQAAAAAIAAPGLVFGPASFQVIPAAGKTVGVSNAPLGAVLSPNGGSFAVLSSGDSTLAPNPQAGAANVSYSGTQNARGAYDVTVLVIPFTVPAGDDCLRFDYASYSEEALGSPFAEGLIAELDTSTWMSTGTTTSSPDNFATDATGTNGKPISVQSPMYFKTGVNGTIYNAGSALLRASTPITPGAHTLYLSVYDVGDSIIDAATFVDNLRTGPVANCVKGTTFAPALNVGDTTITEGDDGTKVASMTVSLPVANDETVTVDYATSNGTATAPGDYTPKTGSLTFAPGETIKTVNIDVLGDDITEAGETVNLTLSNATAVPISDGTGVLTITNDDIANLSVSAVDVTEGNSGTTPSSFTITSSRLSQNPITVGYTTSPGAASAGSDYVTAAGTATIPAGQTSVTLPLSVLGDTTVEGDETFTVKLASPSSGSAITTGTATVTIRNDDSTTLSVEDRSVVEGTASGSQNVAVTLRLTNPSQAPVTVTYSTQDGTAVDPADYDGPTTTATAVIPGGQLTGSIVVPVVRDSLVEGDETFTVKLLEAPGATVAADDDAAVTIQDDDHPVLTTTSASRSEADGLVRFTVTSSNASSKPIGLDYTLQDDTAVAPQDYVDADGTVVIPAGQTSATFDIETVDDAVTEPDERFLVSFLNPTAVTSVTLASGSDARLGTIVNDDVAMVSVGDDVATEGDDGTSKATVRISSSRLSSSDISVDYATEDGSAQAPGDYTAKTATAVIPAGETGVDVELDVVGDRLAEGDEAFAVALTGADGAIVDTTETADRGSVTIEDDDTAALSLDDVTVTEGDTGDVTAVLTASLSNPSTQTVTADYETEDGSATASDYTAKAGSITIPAGETETTISVPVTGDVLAEGDEAFAVQLSQLVGATGTDDRGVVTITDDDTATVSIEEAASVPEGDLQPDVATLLVTSSTPAQDDVVVHYETADGTAAAPEDYDAVADGQVTIPAGQTTVAVPVTVRGDQLVEGDETLDVDLTAVENGARAEDADSGVLTIVDNDVATLSIDDVTVAEADAGTSSATLTVTTSKRSKTTIGFSYQTSDGTAVAPDDYTATTGSGTIAAGEDSTTLTVPVVGDRRTEGDETFAVVLDAEGPVVVADDRGLVTIVDDDATELGVGDVTVDEGGEARFTITASRPSARPVTFEYTTGDGTARAGTDFRPTAGTATIPAGDETTEVTVPTVEDTVNEPTEAFELRLSAPVGASLADGIGRATVTDDDGVAISLGDATALEGNDGSRAVGVTATLDRPAAETVTVDFRTTDGTADSSDYVGAAGTLTIPAGDTTGTISVSVNGDRAPEADETVDVTLSNTSGARLEDASGTLTITNDDVQALSAPVDATPTASTPGAAVDAPCTSRRLFTIKLRPTGRRLASARVTVAGKRVAVTRRSGGRYTARVDLRGRPAGRVVKVRITVRDAEGRLYREVRTYRVCDG